MQFTTQKQQLEEYRRSLREERAALIKRFVQRVFRYACVCLLASLSAIVVLLGWM